MTPLHIQPLSILIYGHRTFPNLYYDRIGIGALRGSVSRLSDEILDFQTVIRFQSTSVTVTIFTFIRKVHRSQQRLLRKLLMHDRIVCKVLRHHLTKSENVCKVRIKTHSSE
jgi:hypothetical protein